MNFFYPHGNKNHNELTPLEPAALVDVVNQNNPFAPFDVSDMDTEKVQFSCLCDCNGNGEFEEVGMEPGSFRHRFRCRVCGKETIL